MATFRIGLRDLGNGSIRVFNINPARPLAEPGRTLWLTNVRTGDRVELVMNANGSLQGRVRVPGRGGDRLRVEAAAAGGRGTAGRAAVVGTLLTPTIHHAPAKKRAPVPCFQSAIDSGPCSAATFFIGRTRATLSSAK